MARTPPPDLIGRTFTQQVMIDSQVRSNPTIQTLEEPYLLTKYNFSVLNRGEGWWKKVGETCLGGTIALFFNLIAKLFGSKIDTSIIFDKWEVFAFVIAVACTIICYGIDYFVPSERKRLVRNINAHFPQI